MKNLGYRKAVCYSGYRENQSPREGIFPTYEQVKEDLVILDKEFGAIRMYEPGVHSRTACEVIRNEGLGLKMMLGMDIIAEYNNPGCPWMKQEYTDEELAAHVEYNNKQLSDLIAQANEYSDVIEFVSAGNEARPSWGSDLVPEDRIVYFINELKANCPQLVTYCEGCDLWSDRHIPKITEAVDFISAHIYPAWNRVSAHDAIGYTILEYDKIKAAWPEKKVIITEAGWATDATEGGQMLKEFCSVEAQNEYVKALGEWAKKENFLLFFFEAFDEPWKGSSNPNEPEKHWGLMDVNRKKKI